MYWRSVRSSSRLPSAVLSSGLYPPGALTFSFALSPGREKNKRGGAGSPSSIPLAIDSPASQSADNLPKPDTKHEILQTRQSCPKRQILPDFLVSLSFSPSTPRPPSGNPSQHLFSPGPSQGSSRQACLHSLHAQCPLHVQHGFYFCIRTTLNHTLQSDCPDPFLPTTPGAFFSAPGRSFICCHHHKPKVSFVAPFPANPPARPLQPIQITTQPANRPICHQIRLHPAPRRWQQLHDIDQVATLNTQPLLAPTSKRGSPRGGVKITPRPATLSPVSAWLSIKPTPQASDRPHGQEALPIRTASY